MDPNADEQAMAAMMGFTSFGAQDRPQKKRRYNPHADAAVHTAAKVHQGRGKAQTTGSNSTPLGARAAPTAGNADEIDLEGDEEDGQDDILGGSARLERPAAIAEEGDLPAQSTPGTDTPHSHGLPQRPAQSAADQARGPPSSRDQPHRRDQHPSAGGGSGAPWYEGYYDTLSNRNPWDKLEKAMGLSAKGTWISHEEHASSAAA